MTRYCVRLAAAVVMGGVLPGGSAFAQAPEQALPASVFDSVTGLYELSGGRLLEIFDLVDQTRRNQLVAVEPASGRVRTLYPVSAGARSDFSFEAGAGWFVREPPDYTLHFESDNGTITGVTLDSGAGREEGHRIRFPERDVQFQNGDVTLSGTLVFPTTVGPHPGVVIVHGSGPLTRRGPRYMADLMAERGIAALVYDKRGTGKSTGAWQRASYEQLAMDANAALDHLLASPEIDPARVGLFGSSEAGYIVPVVASGRPEVNFLVCRVCPSLPQREVAPVQQRSALLRQGFAPEEVEEAVQFHIALIDYAVDRTGYAALQDAFARLRERPWMGRYRFERVPPPDAPYWDGFRAGLTVDPGEYYEQLDIPVLVVLGELDERIAVDQHRQAFLNHAERSGNRDFTVAVMPRSSHGLMEVRIDADGEELPFDRFSPGFHNSVLEWLATRLIP